ncbi:hypothetical protein SAMN05216302_101114 [Nitrosomonas aestuarii]|uniref:Uncharacterized protein n=1 Tax=Nitrosomonas aestuarii TaxID=52441 RepID=A0A1I4B4T9_9PROT|nr:hypothetical protein [Nitrosomonas aestuarii]SFK63370.1 hypothetical protein SAMN05216302_101114 [Nitrosomonas aestuarii]
MLNNVSNGVNRMVRNVVINHPNSWECQVFKKIVNRANPQTIGGMGVLNSDDEDDVSWELLGSGYALSADMFSPSSMTDRLDANNGFSDEARYLIEPENPAGTTDGFSVAKHNVIYIIVSELVRVAYEIVDIETVSNIPPFVFRYVTNRRADLDIMP